GDSWPPSRARASRSLSVRNSRASPPSGSPPAGTTRAASTRGGARPSTHTCSAACRTCNASTRTSASSVESRDDGPTFDTTIRGGEGQAGEGETVLGAIPARQLPNPAQADFDELPSVLSLRVEDSRVA